MSWQSRVLRQCDSSTRCYGSNMIWKSRVLGQCDGMTAAGEVTSCSSTVVASSCSPPIQHPPNNTSSMRT
eukprot:26680-Rhodomonas_salina.1